MDATNPQYIGFWARALAALVDTLVLTAITWPPLFLLYGQATIEPGQLVLGPAHVLISWVFPTVAVILLWRRWQATPGKMLIAARIADASSGGDPSTRQCVIRFFAYLVSALPLGLGYLWIAWDPRKQAWHDKLAGTVVVRRAS